MKKLLLMIIPILAFIGGTFGGALLRDQNSPDLEVQDEAFIATNTPPASSYASPPSDNPPPDITDATLAWFLFPTQFFIPLMKGGQVSGTMILSLIIETPEPSLAHIREQEHRLRDAMLRALMVHANTGGFEGNFTTEPRMNRLRESLLNAAQVVAGDEISGVLIEDLMRQ